MKKTTLSKMVRSRGYSDRLYFLNLRLTWGFVIACLVLNFVSAWLGIESMPIIEYGIPTAFAELGIHTGFIVWKAKAENCKKYDGDLHFIKEDVEG